MSCLLLAASMASPGENPLIDLVIWIGYTAVLVAVIAREWHRLAWVRRHFLVQMAGWMFVGYIVGLAGKGPGADVAYLVAGFAAAKCLRSVLSALRRTGLPTHWWNLLVGNTEPGRDT